MASTSTMQFELPVSPSADRDERCERCRFWCAAAGECRRHAPTAGLAGTTGVWPVTGPDGWCGEWAAREEGGATGGAKFGALAAQLLLARLAPNFSCDPAERTSLLASLLGQLQPNVRKVVVRVNGLDGSPLTSLKIVARELRMSHARVQALLRAGEERLGNALAMLSAGR